MSFVTPEILERLQLKAVSDRWFLGLLGIEMTKPFEFDRVWTDGRDVQGVGGEPKKEHITAAHSVEDIHLTSYEDLTPPEKGEKMQVNTRSGELACALDESRMLMNPERQSEVPLVQEAERRGQSYCALCKIWYESGKGVCRHRDLDEFMRAYDEPART